MYYYVAKDQSFGVFWIKNYWKSTHGAFLSHVDVMNEMVNCWLTLGQTLLLFLCSHMCAPLRVVRNWESD